MDHNAHHALSMIPLYRLRGAQQRFRSAHPSVPHVVLTPAAYLEITRACKLFDPALRQWTDFAGTPTGPRLG